MIDHTFVQRIAQMAEAAVRPIVLPVPDGHPGEVRIALPSGKIEVIKLPPPRQTPQFADVASLVRWAWEMPGRVAWVTLDHVYVTTTDDRHSRGDVPIGWSPQFVDLHERADTWLPLDQGQLVRLLRTTYSGCVPEGTVGMFRAIKVVKNEQQQAEFRNAVSNLGKQITAELTGTAGIPDRLLFMVPVVNRCGVIVQPQPVEVVLDADPLAPPAGKFTLYPLPHDLERAAAAAEGEIMAELHRLINNHKPDGCEPADFPVYRGSPETME